MSAPQHRINPDQPQRELIRAAGVVLRASGIVVHGTETVYGLAARWDSWPAIQRVAAIKWRALDKPLSVMVDDPGQIYDLIGWRNATLETLLERVFPAPLTLVLPRRKPLHPDYWNQFPDLGIRCPDHALSRALAAECGSSIITTSANLAGDPPPVSAGELSPVIRDGVDLILDSGIAPHQVPSTVVRLDPERWTVQVLREGAWPVDRLEQVLAALRSE